jgi:hypothetical protein
LLFFVLLLLALVEALVGAGGVAPAEVVHGGDGGGGLSVGLEGWGEGVVGVVWMLFDAAHGLMDGVEWEV